jgi:putative ABC transport system permease protein
MRIFSISSQLLDTLRHQRLRSTLTILGIAWGTVAVVTLLAFGVGLERQMKKNAKGIGDGVAIVFGGRTTKTFRGFPEGRQIRLVESDAALLRREIPELKSVTVEYGRWETPVRRGTAIAKPYVTGVEPIYAEMRNVIPAAGGRFIDPLDLQGRRRVAVLGDKLKELLFGDADAIGQEVFVGETPFVVVGVMQKKTQNSSYQQRDEDRIFIPATTYQSVFGDRYVARLLYLAGDPAKAETISKQVYEVLGRRYMFDPADKDAVRIWDTSEQLKFFKYMFLGFNLFLGVVGSFTLVVGGIGVANIMYIVVRERTREIGVRRAVGARKHDILLQILVESFLIVAVGAVLGLVISLGIVTGAGMLPIQEHVGTPTISPQVLSATLFLLAGVALLAGLFPARRAAELDPVESLRYGV